MAVASVILSGPALMGVSSHLVPHAMMAALPMQVCLGRLRPMAYANALKLDCYFDQLKVTLAPTNWRAKAAVAIAEMLGNDVKGDCVLACMFHALGVWSANDSDSGGIIVATTQEALSQYSSICGPGDNGCVITAVQDVFRSRGLTAGGRKYTIDAYVNADWTNQSLVWAAQQLFAASAVGINLPQAWTQNAIWDTTNSPIVGGHCVTAIDAGPEGVFVASWGRIYLITWRAWLSRQWVEEYHPMLSNTWYNSDRIAPSGFNAVTLKDDLGKLANGIIPSVDPPPPPPPPGPLPTGDLNLSMDFANKAVSIRLPAGWTVSKMAGESEPMNAQLSYLVSELEETLPKGAHADAAAAGDLGGVVGNVMTLITALKAGDMKAALVAFRDLLTAFIGDGGGAIHFQAQAAAFNFDWTKLINILAKILPLILAG